MSYGKEVCNKLKEIRQTIADQNNIEYETTACRFDGECEGTCPKCDAELQYIEREINKRKHLGKAAAIAGISLSIATTFAACLTGDLEPQPPILTGDIAPPECVYVNN
jgi:hypothetical protein